MDKQYLGDSVYIEQGAELDHVKLTTDNGLGPTNVIYLDLDVIIAMVRYLKDNGVI